MSVSPWSAETSSSPSNPSSACASKWSISTSASSGRPPAIDSMWPYSSTEGKTAKTMGRSLPRPRRSFHAVRRSARSQRSVKCANAQIASRLFSPPSFVTPLPIGLDAGHASRSKSVATAVSFGSFFASGPT